MKLNIYHKIVNKAARKYIILHYYIYKHKLRSKIEKILQFNESNIGLTPRDQEEQALPGFQKYISSRYYKYMLGRYLYSIKYIKNKTVLDSACGLGWGSCLISEYPKEIISIDIDGGALNFARKHWKDKKLNFRNHSILDLDSLHKKFDVILGMEVIEHLTFNQGNKYLEQCMRNLNENGVIVLSSYFPETRKQAEISQKKNKYHLHIFTKQEIKNICKKTGFFNVHFLGNFMVVIKK